MDIDLFDVPNDLKEFNIVNSENNVNNEKIKDLANIGFGVVETKRTPFDVLAVENGFKDKLNDSSPLLVNLENNRV